MMKSVLMLCSLLVILGAINWLSIGVSKNMDANLVAKMCPSEMCERTVYIVIGLAGLLLLVAKVLKWSGKANLFKQ